MVAANPLHAMARIVLIEDYEAERSVLTEALRTMGHEVFAESGGEAGLGRVREFVPDLVITDLLMPGKEGMEIILEVKRCFPAIKIIAISGGGYIGKTDHLKMAKICGATCTLDKPFGPDELKKALQTALG